MARLVFAGTLVLATDCFFSFPSKAVVISVAGNPYDVLVANRSFVDDPSFFSSVLMPWFTGETTDNSLSYDFAQTVFNQLGSYTYPGFSGPAGPLFAYAEDPTNIFAVFQDVFDSSIQNEIAISPAQVYNYAYAVPFVSPAAAPGALPLAGVAMGFSWSRNLRARLHRNSKKLSGRLACRST